MRCRCRRKRRKQISLLVPFQGNDPMRNRVWGWLRRYWRWHLPEVEIVIGRERKSRRHPIWRRHPLPFSKTTAVNNAFRKSHGDIIVIVDADAYIDTEVITKTAHRIRKSEEAGVHLWFVPYFRNYRLRRDPSEELLESSPQYPLRFPSPPLNEDVEDPSAANYGREYGALIMMLSAEAFTFVGGMDGRFRGWGGEDYAFLLALDRLWGLHKYTPNDVLHIWHPRLTVKARAGVDTQYVRQWENEDKGFANEVRWRAYFKAVNDPQEMHRLARGGDV